MWLSETSQRQKGKHFPFSLFVMSRPRERERTRQEVSLLGTFLRLKGNQKTDGVSVWETESHAYPCSAMAPRRLLFSGASGTDRGVKDKASGITS